MQNILLVFLISLTFIIFLIVIINDNNNHNTVYRSSLKTPMHPEKRYNSNITRVIMQTSKNALPNIYVEAVKSKITGWKYEHYTDKDIVRFFKENPLQGFEDVENVFKSLKRGEHRADLFRYYYLYIKGGVYFDTDLMIYKHIEDIIKGYDFVSVNCKSLGWISQFFLATTPKNPIIYEALMDIYKIDKSTLDSDYHIIIKNLKNIVNNSPQNNIYLYNENISPHDFSSKCYDKKTKELLFSHFSFTRNGNVPIQYLY